MIVLYLYFNTVRSDFVRRTPPERLSVPHPNLTCEVSWGCSTKILGFGVNRCTLGSFGAFFKGSFFHLKWIPNIKEFIYLNFSRSPADLKRSTGSLTLKSLNGHSSKKAVPADSKVDM